MVIINHFNILTCTRRDFQWEYEEEDAEDYAWEYETESEDEVVDKEIERRNSKESAASKEEEDIPLDEQDLPDPFSATPLETTTKVKKPEKVKRMETGM